MIFNFFWNLSSISTSQTRVIIFSFFFLTYYNMFFFFDLKSMLFWIFNLLLVYLCLFIYNIFLTFLLFKLYKFYSIFNIFYHRIKFNLKNLKRYLILISDFSKFMSRDFFLFFHFFLKKFIIRRFFYILNFLSSILTDSLFDFKIASDPLVYVI